MWPVVVSKEAMHEVWHMLEFLGNTLIFFLAGALTGAVMTKVSSSDYVWLLVVYLVITLIRGGMLLICIPVLGKLGNPVHLTDVAVMTWGGLRGAVGLALAIVVAKDRAGGQIAPEDGDRVLFLVGGVA